MTTKGKPEPDVSNVLQKIRDRLAVHARKDFAAGSFGPPSTPAPAPPANPIPALRELLVQLQSATGRIGELNPRRPGALNSLAQRAKRLVQRSLLWYTRPILETQALNIHFLTEATKRLELHEAYIRSLEQQIRTERAEHAEVRALLQSQLDLITMELEAREREKR